MTEKAFPKVSGEGLHPSEANSLQIVNVEASENLTAGNIAYIKKNDGKAYLSDTGTVGDIRANGIVLDTVTSGNTANIQVGGNYVTSGLTAAEVYYLGASGAVEFTLPAAIAGRYYTFIRAEAADTKDVLLTPAGSDTIDGGADLDNTADEIAKCKLECLVTGNWVSTSTGTWN